MVSVLPLLLGASLAAPSVERFVPIHPFEERQAEHVDPSGIRAVIRIPERLDPLRPVPVLVFATPNGNTIEQTLGSALPSSRIGNEWRMDIQHVAAQVRALRAKPELTNLCLVVAAPSGLSWPAWRAGKAEAPAQVRSLVGQWLSLIPGSRKEVTLACHSGGGAFLWSFLESPESVPSSIRRFAWLDANYSFDAARHLAPLKKWLRSDPRREISVLAYDDRKVTIEGKPIVSETGGTYRASQRMIEAFHLSERTRSDETWETTTSLNRQLDFRVHRNPGNALLHTRLVGEMNGVMWPFDRRAPLDEKRRYRSFISPPSEAYEWQGVPKWDAPVLGADDWIQAVSNFAGDPNESVKRDEITRRFLLSGNVPSFLRRFVPVRLKANDHVMIVLVSPDVLSVGSDQDWVRTPMMPNTAQEVADRTKCLLMTDRISDAVHAQADLRLSPSPLTVLREATSTFVQHHRIIERQRTGFPVGLLVSGIKKDVILTNRLSARPNRVALYGWHRSDGKPIQPVYAGHTDRYVDYSHGVRLVSARCWIDGQEADLRQLLQHPELSVNLSSDGPLARTSYPIR